MSQPQQPQPASAPGAYAQQGAPKAQLKGATGTHAQMSALPALATPLPNFFPESAPDPDAALSLRGLVKYYGHKVAVSGVSLDIPVGSFYGILGPNGAGKTTTLSMATGLLKPTGGHAWVHGVSVWDNPERAKQLLGVLPDGLRVFDRLRGRELIAYAGMLHGLAPAIAKTRAAELITALGLDSAALVPVSDYSAGMTKKIVLATALVHSPKVLVLDEPFESVDPISARAIRQILDQFRASGGTVVFSSHAMATVERLCTHVAIIAGGQVLTSGPTAQVANGMDLDSRFLELVGNTTTPVRLSWLKHPVDTNIPEAAASGTRPQAMPYPSISAASTTGVPRADQTSSAAPPQLPFPQSRRAMRNGVEAPAPKPRATSATRADATVPADAVPGDATVPGDSADTTSRG